MATNTENIAGIVQHRRGTSEEWKLSTVIPYEGELVIEECEDGTCRCKIGDGKNTFEYLSYTDDAATASIKALRTQVEQNASDIKLANTTVSNLKREVNGVKSAVQSIVDPHIEKLDAKYSARLDAMEVQHDADIADLKASVAESAEALTKSFENSLDLHAAEATRALDDKVTIASLDLSNRINTVNASMQKCIADVTNAQSDNKASIDSINKDLKSAKKSLSDFIDKSSSKIDASDLKIAELVTEVTKLKELGYGDIVTSEMIGQLRAVEAKVAQLNTSDTNVLTQLYSVKSSLNSVNRQLKELKATHNTDLSEVKGSIVSLNAQLTAADTELLAKINAELAKLWTEITDLVDDDIELYNTFTKTSTRLSNKVDSFKTSLESSLTMAKKELTDKIDDKETHLKDLLKAEVDDLSAKLEGAKAELADSISGVKTAGEKANKAIATSIDSLRTDTSKQYDELADKILETDTDIAQYKTSVSSSFGNVDDRINSIDRKLIDTDLQLAADQERLNSQEKQISQIVRLEEGSTTGDAELINARTGFDGKVHESVGEYLRELEGKIKQHTGADAIAGLHYDVKGEVGLKAPYYLYLTNAKKEILQDTGVQIVSGAGGGGEGSVATSDLKITFAPHQGQDVIFRSSDEAVLEFIFTGKDASGDIISRAEAEWYFNGVSKVKSEVADGENSFDVTKYLEDAKTTVLLKVTDGNGSTATKIWRVTRVELELVVDTFKDKLVRKAADSFIFNYKPYGTVDEEDENTSIKLVIKIDDKIIGHENEGYSKEIAVGSIGQYDTYTNNEALKGLAHGTHRLEAYLKVTTSTLTFNTASVFKELLIADPNSTEPIIGVENTNITMDQYDKVKVVYTVYDPIKNRPIVNIYLDNEPTPVVSGKEISPNSDYYSTNTAEYIYEALEAGTHTITIECRETKKTVTVDVKDIEKDLSPVSGPVFDFNPVFVDDGSKIWEDNGITMEFSDDFDWINGGYKIDENGDRYFCVKAGTTATINYNLFADSNEKIKTNGKEFKVIFRTANVAKRDTSFLSCLANNVGLDMRVEHAIIYDGSTSYLKSDYCEDTIIEYEFNINPSADMPIIMSYEDGTPSKPYEYTSNSSFSQLVTEGEEPKPIIIGSPDCDVHIYRIKVYGRSLLDEEVLKNFIADARNLNEKLARFNRNNIYDSGKLVTTSANGSFSVGPLMEAAPDLRYVFLEVPQFTNDKDNKIDGCTVYFRYPAGTRPQDNWTCTGVRHRGQGTSSNAYGYAGRNLDLCMDRDESLFTWYEKDAEGNDIAKTGRKITLTDTSVPTDYLNIKVNIASSENANNAELARRFNKYQPFLRYARKKDSCVKDTMEFYNCVIFIRETSTDTKDIPHREFDDNNWHFYAIGNIGDSKKTDYTRVNNANDPREHVVEIMDADVPLAAFPKYIDKYTYKYVDVSGKANNVEFESETDEWATGNAAYDLLHSDIFSYDDKDIGEFKSFGGTSFEFRYEKDGITDEDRLTNINTWRNFYDFVVTSTDEDFYANLKNYFVVDSALYYYLFTERYTMVDNRAKNSFWHYGKVYVSNEEAAELGATEASYYIIDDDAAAINDGYRYDLTFGYDMDTALGIDNTGDYVFAYGKEDTDYYRDDDPTSGPVFRVNTSAFFCKLRDLFRSELRTMFQSREDINAWSSDALVSQWDDSQSKFPEELWRLDYERKYYRTYRGISIDSSIKQAVDKAFLIGKFFGRKKYARRAFETNQEIYFATKYFGKSVVNDTDTIWIRGNENEGKQDYSITVTPHLDMYPLIKYGSTGSFEHGLDAYGKPIRLKAGNPYTFQDDATSRDFIYIGAPGWIQKLGDLSKCYISDNSFAKGTRLQSLTLGDSDDDYKNTNLKAIDVSSNMLLGYLDISNVSGLSGALDLKTNINLETLKAFGTNISSVSFADSGKIKKVVLPSTINKLDLKNLKYLSSSPDYTEAADSYFNLPDEAKVSTLVVENCPNFTIDYIRARFINAYDSGNRVLTNIRLTGMSFKSYVYADFISDFDGLRGVDDNGSTSSDPAHLNGTVHFTGTLTGEQYNYVSSRYPELSITYDRLESKLSFMDIDGETEFAESQNITDDPSTLDDNNGTNPVTETNKPQKAPSENGEFEYSFVGWSTTKNLIIGEDEEIDSDDYVVKPLCNIVGDRVLYPVFKEIRLSYEVTFINRNNAGEDQITVLEIPYGSNLADVITEPEKLGGTPDLYEFIGWANSLGDFVETVSGNITVYAQFVVNDGYAEWYTLSATDITHVIDDVNKKLELKECKNTENSAVRVPKTMEIGSGYYTIDKVGGFKGYKKLEALELPDTVTAITDSGYSNSFAYGAFNDCSSLAHIALPDSLISIGNYAFVGCSKLEEITIPATVNSLGDGLFAKCFALNKIDFSGENRKYGMEADCLVSYNEETGRPDKVLHGLPSCTRIPEDSTALGPYCFYAHGIDYMELPNSVTKIGSNAFYGCTKLAEVKLSENITTIDGSAFSSCTSLRTANLPARLETIGVYAFSKCALSKITIPSSVVSISQNAFGEITVASAVTFNGRTLLENTSQTAKPIHADAFKGATNITFNLPWSEEEHTAKFGSQFAWGAKNASFNFNYSVEE